MKAQIVRFLGIAAVAGTVFANHQAHASNSPNIFYTSNNGSGTTEVVGDYFTPGGLVILKIYNHNTGVLVTSQEVYANNGPYLAGWITTNIYIGCGSWPAEVTAQDVSTGVYSPAFYFSDSCE